MRTKRLQAFTLVELLVVIGIIALLVSLLLPTLGKAQRAARSLQCASNMRTIMQGVQLYAAAYKNTFPGSPWTSGAHVRMAGTPASLIPPGVTANSTNTNCPGVVSYFDWISPVAKMLGYPFDEGAGIAARQSRYLQFLRPSVFMCPENQFLTTAFGTDWGTLPPPSYTTSADFMFIRNTFGTNGSGYPANASAHWGYLISRTEWNAPSGYKPQMNKVGNASEKVFLSEGSRFINSSLVWTYNSTVTSVQNGGSHSDQRLQVSFAFARSRMLFGYYGDRTVAQASGGGRWLLPAYRHGARHANDQRDSYKMNMAFFDGHVETVNVTQSVNPKWHSPKGTEMVLNSTQVVPLSYQAHNNNIQTTTFVVP